jgi:hypothetical protein
MRPTGDMTTTTDEVIDRFNRAFQERYSKTAPTGAALEG